jgi:hypothetical protein
MFDWDDDNVEHVQRHGVEPEEVEEVLQSPARLRVPVHRTNVEERRAVLGYTETGRLLYVVITRRAGRTRVVTARDATDGEKKRYRRSKT